MSFAAFTGNLALCAYVYEHGGAEDVRTPDFDGWTPMLRAAKQGHVHIVEWLFKHGAAGDIRRPNVLGGYDRITKNCC